MLLIPTKIAIGGETFDAAFDADHVFAYLPDPQNSNLTILISTGGGKITLYKPLDLVLRTVIGANQEREQAYEDDDDDTDN